MWLLVKNIYESVTLADDKPTAIRNNLGELRSVLDMAPKTAPSGFTSDGPILFLLMNILMRESEDSMLLADLMRTVAADSELRNLLLKQIKIEMMAYVLYHSQKARFNLWGILPFDSCETTDQQNLIREFGMKGNLQAVSILIKYGGAIEKAGFTTRQLPMIPLEQPAGEVFPMQGRLNWEGKPRRKMLMDQIVYFAKRPTQEDKSCIQLIWRSLPDPYPTRPELTAHIATIDEFKSITREGYWTAVSKICKFFQETISEKDFECLEPRSLQQLCRCGIRKQLLESTNLPDGITSLKLPRELKEYVNLDH